jgi:hypothetical protein
LGSNGSGDPIVIELSSRAIAYLNHDDGMRRVFINSSVATFAESLLLFQEAQIDGAFASLPARLASLDAAAAGPDTMWAREISLENEQHEG